MQTDFFLVGRYIHWQETIYQITAYQGEDHVHLETWPIKASCIIELAVLQKALADGSLLIGVAVEQDPKSKGKNRGGTYQEEAERLQGGTVITYRPVCNLEPFFTTYLPKARDRRITRSRQGHRDTMSWRSLKRQRRLSSFYLQSNQPPSHKYHISPKYSRTEERAEPRYIATSDPELNQSSLEALRHALQVPGPITIRWLNYLVVSCLPEPLLVRPGPAKNPYPVATNLCEADHHVFDLTTDDQTATKPTCGILLDKKSQLVIGYYLIFHHI